MKPDAFATSSETRAKRVASGERMALGVDLFGMSQDDTVVWKWMAGWWNGHDVLDLVKPPPSDPWPAWEGQITREQIGVLRAKVNPPAYIYAELDEKLAISVARIDVRVEEWGSE